MTPSPAEEKMQAPPPAQAQQPPPSALAEKEREIRSLRRRLEQATREKAELESASSHQALQRKLEALKVEQSKMNQQKVDLENELEQEQEFIVNRIHKQSAGLQGEKEDLAQQVAELTATTRRLHEEKISLENQMESEEEAIVNRLQRQIEHLLAKYKALEALAQSHGVDTANLVVPGGRDPALESSLEWAYARTPSRAGSEPGSMRPSMSGGSSNLGRSSSPRHTEPGTPHSERHFPAAAHPGAPPFAQ